MTSYGLSRSQDVFPGTVFQSETWVRARWPWIVLPAVLQLASIVLLASAIAYSKKQQVPIWKSSILATCYHEFETDEDVDSSLERLSDMDKAASDRVLLFSRSDGQRLISRSANEEAK